MTSKSKIQILPNPKQTLNLKSKLNWDFDIGIYFVVLVVLVVFGFTLNSYAQPISSSELISNAEQYDGKSVVYEGEVIGDIMRRGHYAWINVNDGNNAIGIWLPSSWLKDITYTGSYKTKGDGIEIAGILRRACPEHGGDLDIHAQGIRKTGAGRPVVERLNAAKRNQVVILLGVLCFIWILSLFIRK